MMPPFTRDKNTRGVQRKSARAGVANKALRLAAVTLAALAVGALGWGFQRIAAAAEPNAVSARTAQGQPGQRSAADEKAPPVNIPSSKLAEPDAIAKSLVESPSSPTAEKTPVVCVGFKFLYESAHIPGALYLGPARTAEGLDSLQKWARDLPRNKTVVIYCGCCPWDKCPNIRPAYAALEKMGFTNVKVIHIAQDFGKDWVDKGYAVEKTAAGDSAVGNSAGDKAKP